MLQYKSNTTKLNTLHKHNHNINNKNYIDTHMGHPHELYTLQI